MVYLQKKYMTITEIKTAAEFFFLPNANKLKFSHKEMTIDGFQTMICYFENENGNKYEMSIQVEDDEYVNVHLKKIMKGTAFELGFINYLTSIAEMTATLNFLTKLYMLNEN